MRFLKKLAMTVWFLATVFAFAALLLTIFGPWTKEALALYAIDNYSYAVQGCAAFSLIGGFVMWVRVLARRKKAQTIELEDEEGSTIAITRDAIASQATYIVEEDGSCEATKVSVYAGKHGMVSVFVTIRPHETVSAIEKGQELKQELEEGLTKLCGERIESVSLEFLAPEEPSSLSEPASYDHLFEEPEEAAGEAEPAQAEDADVSEAEPSEEGADEDSEETSESADAEEDADEPDVRPAATGDGVTISMKGRAPREEETHE
ncbi:MAG: alkaline shock response membrane anchor protein AmaP [Atopobiaceae bacterium]